MQSVEALLPARLICSAERTGKEAGARRESEEQNWKLHSMNGLDEADPHSKGFPPPSFVTLGREGNSVEDTVGTSLDCLDI